MIQKTLMWLHYQLFHGILCDIFMLAKHKDHITKIFFAATFQKTDFYSMPSSLHYAA